MNENPTENAPAADTAPLPVPEAVAPEPPVSAYAAPTVPEPPAPVRHGGLPTGAWVAIGVAGALLFGVVAFGAGWGARSITLHFGGPRGTVASQQFGQGGQQFEGRGYGHPGGDAWGQRQDEAWGQGGQGDGRGYGQGRGMMPRGQMPGQPWGQGESGIQEDGGWDR